MGILIFGVVFIVAGAVCFYLKRSEEGTLMALSLTETYEVAKLKQLSQEINAEIGKGSFKQLVEVRGKIECDSPLCADISKEPCVYYKCNVRAEYEEEYFEEDPQTKNRVRKIRKEYETLSDINRDTYFYVNDGTGKIKINPAGAEIDCIKSVDRFEPATSFSGSRLSIGDFFLDLGNDFLRSYERRRILGYHITEELFSLNKNVFVLGEISDSMGELMIGRSTEKNGRFIITNKSEDELRRESESGVKTYDIISKVCFVVGIIMVIYGAIKG